MIKIILIATLITGLIGQYVIVFAYFTSGIYTHKKDFFIDLIPFSFLYRWIEKINNLK